MSDPAVGYLSGLGVAPETTEGVPVKALKKANFLSGGIDRNLTAVKSQYIDGSNTQFKKPAPGGGPASFAGPVKVEVYPEGATPYLFYAAMGTPTTIGVGGAGGTPAHFLHRFFKNIARGFVTMIQPKSALGAEFYQVNPGVAVSGFSISTNADQQNVIELDLACMALDELYYNVASQVGMDTATVDTLAPFAGVDCILYVGGTPQANAKDFTVSTNPGTKEKRTLRGKRGAAQMFKGLSSVTASANLYFDQTQVMQVAGTPQATYPFGIQGAMQPTEIRLAVVPQAKNAANYLNQLHIVLPAATYDNISDPVSNQDEIMQAVTIQAYKDPVTGVDLYFELYNGMTYAQVVSPGTNIASVPANFVQPAGS